MKKHKTNRLEFELFYLAMLTREGIKPLSRWEKTLSPYQVSVLESFDLSVAHVSRRLQNGTVMTESVFSKSEGSIDFYLSFFEGTSVLGLPVLKRLEGMLFGFPSCCIEHFLQHGYIQNSLDDRDQQILFHWACPDCKVTEQLLPLYRKIYKTCEALQCEPVNIKTGKTYLKPLCAGVTALSVLISGVGILSPSLTHAAPQDINPHHLDLPEGADLDSDFLDDRYESICNTEPYNADSDSNGELDGIQAAKELAAAVDSLPHSPKPDRTYISDFMMRGLETCSVCKETVNMGYAVITNPIENLSIEIPYISLHHFLKHGSFAYDGDVHHKDYMNAGLLYAVVFGKGRSHFALFEPDSDSDGLQDSEEMFWGNDPHRADTDGNGLWDGRQLAQRYAAEIDSLLSQNQHIAYIVEHKMRGTVMCPQCGQTVNMGYMMLVNPERKDSLRISYLQHHFLHCGSFAIPEEPDSLVVAHRLRDVLSNAADLHELEVVSDADQDGLTDTEEQQLETNVYHPDEDGNGRPDGSDLALNLAAQINTLPDSASKDGAYVTHHLTYGLETCHICGQQINMGYLTISHPRVNTIIDVPYIALHYMQHGSFSYHGSVNSGRISPVVLSELLSLRSFVSSSESIPRSARLMPAFPNPFNSVLSIPLQLDSNCMTHICIQVFNSNGCCIRHLLNATMSGKQVLQWDGTDDRGRAVASGTFIISCQLDDEMMYRTITLVR